MVIQMESKIEVGAGVTYLCGSDRYPFSIIEVINERTIRIQSDISTPAPGYDYYSNQVHTFAPNPKGRIRTLTLRKDGRWIEKGQSMKSFSYVIGIRSEYSDPSF